MTSLASSFAVKLFLTTEDIVNSWERMEYPRRNVRSFKRYTLKDFFNRKEHNYSISESQLNGLNLERSRVMTKFKSQPKMKMDL